MKSWWKVSESKIQGWNDTIKHFIIIIFLIEGSIISNDVAYLVVQ